MVELKISVTLIKHRLLVKTGTFHIVYPCIAETVLILVQVEPLSTEYSTSTKFKLL